MMKYWAERGLLFVRIRSDVVKYMRDADLELVRDGRHPRVAVAFEDLLHTNKVQIS